MGNIQRHHQTMYTRDISQFLDSYAHKVEGKKNVDTCFESSVAVRLAGSDIKIAGNYIQVTAQTECFFKLNYFSFKINLIINIFIVTKIYSICAPPRPSYMLHCKFYLMYDYDIMFYTRKMWAGRKFSFPWWVLPLLIFSANQRQECNHARATVLTNDMQSVTLG